MTTANTSTAQPPQEGGQTISETTVQSASLTIDARRKRYKELRARLGKSRLEVAGKKGRHYFWADRNDSKEMTNLELAGYSIVREPKPKEVLAGTSPAVIRANGLKSDGTYILGDVILMDCDMEVYEFILLSNEEKSRDQLQSAKDNFLIEAEREGVPTFEVDRSKR